MRLNLFRKKQFLRKTLNYKILKLLNFFKYNINNKLIKRSINKTYIRILLNLILRFFQIFINLKLDIFTINLQKILLWQKYLK